MRLIHSAAIAAFTLAALASVAAGCGEEDIRQAGEQVETQAREAGERVGEETGGARTAIEEQFGRAVSAVDPDHTVAITNFICPLEVEGAEPAAGNVIAMVEIEVTNTEEREIEIEPADFKLESDDGEEREASTALGGDEALKGKVSIQPGSTIKRQLFFEVPEGKKVPNLVDELGIDTVKISIPGQQ